MSIINTNISSMIAQRSLSASQGALNTAMQRLSSGMRINSAKDDAVGQAIANRMGAQLTGLNQATRNANDGISLAQTAEGALNQVNDNLQRIRELTVQAKNGANSAADIDSIQKEVNQRLAEIDRITDETEFNGINLFDTAGATSFNVQVGTDDGDTIAINIGASVSAGTLSTTGWNMYSATGAAGVAAATGTRTTNHNGFDVLSSTALASLDAKLSAVDTARSDLGALQNRLQSAINNISSTTVNLSDAQSRIQDANYATEVANMTRAQILQQAGTSVLAQANQAPQNVLSLLR